jgi:glycosyltransferase involved in cell wall biosynthesis
VNHPNIAVLWVHYGPYHMARLRALQERCAVTAIQFASGQRLYGWHSASNSGIVTLRDEVHERAGSYRAARKLWRVLQRTRPDVLLIPGYRETLAIVAALWGKMHGRTNVLMSDSTACDRPRSSWKERAKGLLTAVLFHNGFVSGRRAAEYLRSIARPSFVRETGYDVVDNAFFQTRVAEIRATMATGGGRRPFLFVGRLHPDKNLRVLLEAFGEYRRQGGASDLEIAGAGPQSPELQEIHGRIGLGDSIRFLGYREYGDLPECYARARCLILPSVSEPWGLVVNEAMAAGLPVIVSDRCGCVDDLVEDGSNGFVFPANDAHELAGRMRRIDALSAAAWDAMARRSQEIVARFSPETWADAVVRMAYGGGACRRVA